MESFKLHADAESARHPRLQSLFSIMVLVATLSAAIADDYGKLLEQYQIAQQKYEDETNTYWSLIAQKRLARIAKRRNNEPMLVDDYVLSQPPVYSGPLRPADPASSPQGGPTPPVRYVPVVADFLRFAAEHFEFVPERPRDEMEYKRAYAQLASTAGLTKEQAVRIYAFEAGGTGTYDMQAGLEQIKPGARAISTALGYNQLLAPNSIGLMAEKGDQFLNSIREKAGRGSSEAKTHLEAKLHVLQRMIDFCRTVPDRWSEHEKLATTSQGLAVHAAVLDRDIGPLLQVQKLVDSVIFARERGYESLKAVELELMNLTGDGNGIDMVMMPPAMRLQVPTSNFFQRGGYDRNPIASRNNVVAKLFEAISAVMDEESKLPGAVELAAAFPD